MKAFRVLGWESIGQLMDVPVPTPGKGEVLVRIGGAGICHTDLHLMRQWNPTSHPILKEWSFPFTLGHENAGWVEELGPGVTGWDVGQGVVVSPAWGCGQCPNCRSGFENYCESPAQRSAGLGMDGGLAEFMVAPSRHLLPFKRLEPWEAAALTDAGLSSYHAVKTVSSCLDPNDAVVVIGVGGLGHLALAYLKALTPARLIAVDRDEGALELALQQGAELVFKPDRKIRAEIRGATDGLGAKAVLDFVGASSTLKLAVSVIRPRGRIAVVGLGGGILPLRHGIVPFGVFLGYTFAGSKAELAEVVALAERGIARPTILRFCLDEVQDVYSRLERGEIRGRAVIST